MTAHPTNLTASLADQLEWHWQASLRPRLDGLTDDEYFWEPVPDCWTVHRDGAVDFAHPAPEPPPFTTIAWRLAHLIVGVLAVRTYSHFGGPPASYESWPYATDASTALRQLDEAYDGWISGVTALSANDLTKPIGPVEGQFAERPMTDLVLHINREVIHHGAEIACIRDLYLHSNKEN
jgi:hypothetical protein